MTPDDTKRFIASRPPGFFKRNPHLVAGLPAVVNKPNGGAALERRKEAARRRTSGPVYRVGILGVRARLLDSDNFISGCKGLRDAIAERLRVDDSDKFVRWEYSQHESRGREGIIVTIQEI